MLLAERQGKDSDCEWIWHTYCESMKTSIEEQWGWDEAFQRENFNTYLPATDFVIVSIRGENVAAYLLRERSDHFWLEMILVEPSHQRHGIGCELLKTMQSKAAEADRPLSLSVINSNPVHGFYEQLGFVTYEQDADFSKMRWAP